MTAESKSLRSRAFLLEEEVYIRFRDNRLTDRDFIDDSNDLFLISMSPMDRRDLVENLHSRLRAKQIALSGKDYLWVGDSVHTAATNLVNDMLTTLEQLTAAMDDLGV
jgi:hypothetical protein